MVQVSVPYRCSEEEAHEFISQKSKWIFKKIEVAKRHQQIINSKRFCSGHEFLFLGKSFSLMVNPLDIKRSRIDFDGRQWKVDVPRDLEQNKKEQAVKAKLMQWYRKQAEEILGGRIFHYARIMDLHPDRIAVKSFKRLWGNCDYSTRSIQLNWQIILSPLKVVDYVIIHELCHLVHPNHSKHFWRKVEKFMPDFRKHKRWLSDHSVNMSLP